nr:MAG TPA_asm: hypothetical protein [Caudoviricetes sp.]
MLQGLNQNADITAMRVLVGQLHLVRSTIHHVCAPVGCVVISAGTTVWEDKKLKPGRDALND